MVVIVADGAGNSASGRLAAVLGASVGDSEAWLLSEGATCVLTEGQQRKPLLGTGRARPVAFKQHCGAGTLLAATDGLFKYVPPERIRKSMEGPDLDHVAQELSEMPRLLSGALPDDVGLVLCRFGLS